jgi:hypothetical protein
VAGWLLLLTMAFMNYSPSNIEKLAFSVAKKCRPAFSRITCILFYNRHFDFITCIFLHDLHFWRLQSANRRGEKTAFLTNFLLIKYIDLNS